jgi:hypothetical protein
MQTLNTTRKTGPVLLLVSLVACLPGCLNTESWVHSGKPAPATMPTVSAVSLVWKGLIVTQDVVNAGQPLPGIAGRMYLLGPDLATPVLCDGKVRVDMYVPEDGKWKALTFWEYHPTDLQRMVKKDVIGDGYTLFLPWYDTTIAQAQLRVTFFPAKGNPIYAQPSIVNIRPQAPIPIHHEVRPGTTPVTRPVTTPVTTPVTR